VDDTLTGAVGRVKKALDDHTEDYVTVAAADLALLAAQPGVAATNKAAFAAIAAGAARAKGVVSLHRDKHLTALLKAAAGE
jgi:hypothetical protein